MSLYAFGHWSRNAMKVKNFVSIHPSGSNSIIPKSTQKTCTGKKVSAT